MSVAVLLRRHILEPAWSRYSGAKLLSAGKELERSQFLSEAELHRLQMRRLKDLLRFVNRHNGFYRQRFERSGVVPESVNSMDDLRRIPILTKSEVRARAPELLSDGFDASRLMNAKTGGSTGKPIELFFTEEVSQLRNASGRRNKRWAGWNVGEPVGAVWGNPIEPKTVKERLRRWILDPTISLDTMSITAESVRAFARQWQQVRPTLLFGHAHSVFVLATMVEEMQISEIQPHAIIASSMMLLPHERKVIERAFGVAVTDIYGCEEVGLIAGECERHEGLHTNVDQLIVEVVREDGSPVKCGEAGLVVVTDLLNYAMPFIRYRMEDMAEVSQAPCSCGRGAPTLRRIVGRTADFLKRLDGSRVAGISLIENTLTSIPGIEQMQIVQDALSHIVVRIVPGSDFSPDRRDQLSKYFSATFQGATIELEDVSAIVQEANGKYRFSICMVPD
jgi:phenylacetate-coenzyme A ligase PaaK-like adenylate-forming protein